MKKDDYPDVPTAGPSSETFGWSLICLLAKYDGITQPAGFVSSGPTWSQHDPVLAHYILRSTRIQFILVSFHVLTCLVWDALVKDNVGRIGSGSSRHHHSRMKQCRNAISIKSLFCMVSSAILVLGWFPTIGLVVLMLLCLYQLLCGVVGLAFWLLAAGKWHCLKFIAVLWLQRVSGRTPNVVPFYNIVLYAVQVHSVCWGILFWVKLTIRVFTCSLKVLWSYSWIVYHIAVLLFNVLRLFICFVVSWILNPKEIERAVLDWTELSLGVYLFVNWYYGNAKKFCLHKKKWLCFWKSRFGFLLKRIFRIVHFGLRVVRVIALPPVWVLIGICSVLNILFKVFEFCYRLMATRVGKLCLRLQKIACCIKKMFNEIVKYLHAFVALCYLCKIVLLAVSYVIPYSALCLVELSLIICVQAACIVCLLFCRWTESFFVVLCHTQLLSSPLSSTATVVCISDSRTQLGGCSSSTSSLNLVCTSSVDFKPFLTTSGILIDGSKRRSSSKSVTFNITPSSSNDSVFFEALSGDDITQSGTVLETASEWDDINAEVAEILKEIIDNLINMTNADQNEIGNIGDDNNQEILQDCLTAVADVESDPFCDAQAIEQSAQEADSCCILPRCIDYNDSTDDRLHLSDLDSSCTSLTIECTDSSCSLRSNASSCTPPSKFDRYQENNNISEIQCCNCFFHQMKIHKHRKHETKEKYKAYHRVHRGMAHVRATTSIIPLESHWVDKFKRKNSFLKWRNILYSPSSMHILDMDEERDKEMLEALNKADDSDSEFSTEGCCTRGDSVDDIAKRRLTYIHLYPPSKYITALGCVPLTDIVTLIRAAHVLDTMEGMVLSTLVAGAFYMWQVLHPKRVNHVEERRIII